MVDRIRIEDGILDESEADGSMGVLVRSRSAQGRTGLRTGMGLAGDHDR
jgi:hypothetical protein